MDGRSDVPDRPREASRAVTWPRKATGFSTPAAPAARTNRPAKPDDKMPNGDPATLILWGAPANEEESRR